MAAEPITMKSMAIFLTGVFCGIALLGGVHALRKTSGNFKALDHTDVYSDQQVRQTIKDSGILLPAASWNLFYAINGFQDHGIWIALTVPRDQLWTVVEASLHKTKEDFAAGIPQEFLSRVELGTDQKIDTSSWNPETIKKPLHFSFRKKNTYEDWVVDEENGRIFVTKSNT
jgi:hypothetical protein